MVDIDPITVQVLSNVLLTIADEMGVTLIRSAYSTNIKERRDCSTAIFDSLGRTIAQAEHIPVHLGSMLGIIHKVTEKYPLESIRPGDMFIANDPYSGGGTHLPDITLAAPVFFNGKLVSFVANVAHHSDIGGSVAGSTSGDCTNIFQEGLRVPPVKLIDGGQMRNEILDLILLNCRTPRERLGDLRAQIAANSIGLKRMAEVYAKYGRVTVELAMEEVLNYSERKIRKGITAITDGTYNFTDYMDDDGIMLDKIPIQVAVTISGDHINLDFTGTAPQAKGGINVVHTALLATVYYALKAIIDPSLPSNAGFYRAISVIAPEGTIVNAVPPAAVAGRTDTCQRIADVIFGAMARAVPDKVVAGCNSAVTTVIFSGVDPKRKEMYVYLESLGGGLGARPFKDGMDGVHVHVTNTSNLPVECLENEYPLEVDRYEFLSDSGGAGQYRGGLGFRRDIRIVGHDCTFASHGDRQKLPPWGLFGGQAGLPGGIVINPRSRKEYLLPTGKVSGVALNHGDVVSIRTPGSGGYGDPGKRAPLLVAKDVREGKVSAAAAAEDYPGITLP